jgi:hypothetical protein
MNKKMLVSKTLETPEGHVKFEGELEPNELDLVIKLGLNYLLQMGALPLTSYGTIEDHPQQ